MQSLEKCHKRGCLRRAQVLPIRRHVAASLDHLADELILREPHGNTIQRGTSLPTHLPKGVAVAALLDLKNECSLPFKGGCAMQKLLGHGIAAPGVHVRAPGSESSEMRKCPKRYRDEQDGQDGDRPPAPALFPFPREERQKKQSCNHDDRADEKCWSLKRRGKQREQAIEPQKEVIGLRHCLNDRRVGTTGWTEGTEVQRAGGYGQKDERCEEHVLPDRVGNEWRAILLRQFMIFVNISGLADHAPGHWPLINSQFQNHQKVNGHKCDEKPGDDEHVQSEES